MKSNEEIIKEFREKVLKQYVDPVMKRINNEERHRMIRLEYELAGTNWKEDLDSIILKEK